ncbi:hypothetical protein, conserved [Eimeria necatrix]|uniref:Metallo-beta-lactamase domain-containing protein n=1 Tax=Eimeria necatrix TaxID=51315 RepID=U6MYP1_9EIME|nr:hypothetical protein, conserved [Eimeria necatrix]CDJ66825.1 hypothetical protein, conserved [Eimeria necatrix]
MNGAALRRIRQHRKLPWLALLLFLQLLSAASPFAVYTVPHALCIDSKEAVGSSGVAAGACILLPRKSPLHHAPESWSTRRIPQCGTFSVDFEDAGAAPLKHTVGKTFATASQAQAYTSTGANEVPGGPSVATPATAAAADIENAFSEVVAAAEAVLSTNFTSSSESRNGQDVSVSPWAASTSEAVETARASFLAKVANAFGLKRISDASGVVYVHRSGTSNAKLLVDRQLLLRLRGEQQKGSWSLHFLGTGAMQASATRGTSCILFSRGDGSAWLFDCGGGPSPTYTASVCRRDATIGAASDAVAEADQNSRLKHAVALAVATEAITRTTPAAAAALQHQHQQETRKRRMGVVQRVFVTHLHGDHCLGLPSFLSQIAESPEEGPRHVEIVGPEGLRSLLRCILHGTAARRLPSFSVVELRCVPHLHHRRSRVLRLPPLPPAPFEISGRGDIEPNADGSYVAFEDSEIVVTAAPIRHLVPCVGYILTEKINRHRLRADVIDPLIEKNSQHLKDPSRWPQLRGEPKAVYRLLSELKAGEVFSFPDGTQVGPADIFLGAPHPRKICFAFDTCDASRLLPFAQGADILVHEATMSGVKGTSSKWDPCTESLQPKPHPGQGEGHLNGHAEGKALSAKDLMGAHVQTASQAAFERGHSSAAMAGSFAFRAGAARLLLTHFSQRYRGDPFLRSVLTMERVEEEARQAYDIERQLQAAAPPASTLKVTAAWDGLAVVLPQRTYSPTEEH